MVRVGEAFCLMRCFLPEILIKIGRKEIDMRQFHYTHLEQDLFTPDIINMVSAIHEYKGKEELLIGGKPDILRGMLEVTRIQSTGASNRIEGIFTSDERLRELVTHKAEPQNRSEAEIAGYREVLAAIHENHAYILPRPNHILQLHRDLYAFTPSASGGMWKISDNVIAEEDQHGQRKIRFQPVSAFATPDAMERLCTAFLDAVNDETYDPLLLIPIFVLDFLCIHPFLDGNGRMSRLLTLLLLYRAGYMVGKYVSIEMIIEGSKETYYESLQDSSQGWHENANAYAPFVRYSLGVVLNAYRTFTERVQHVQNGKVSKPERVRAMFGKKLGKVTKKDIVVACPDISLATVEATLGDMVRTGSILKIGAGKNTGYVLRNQD